MDLNLVSCNIRFDNPADGANAWAHRRDFLSQVLLKHSPDILATQEGRIDQLKDLELALDDLAIVDAHRSWIGERMYPSIYINLKKFELLGSGDVWLSETPGVAGSRSFDSAFPRLFTWARLQIRDSDQKLFCVSTHLDHVKSETRQAQAKVLCAEVQKHSEQCPLILMGDFNEGPQGEVRKIVQQTFGLTDTWAQHNPTEETSHHAFRGELQNGSRIDWILVDPKLRVLSSTLDKSHRNGFYPTDHFPVVARVTL